MCCDDSFFRKRKKKVVTQPPSWVRYDTSSRNPVAGEAGKMKIGVQLDNTNTTFGIPRGAKVGDIIRFTATGPDIVIQSLDTLNGTPVIVVNMAYDTYLNQAEIYYYQDGVS